MRDSVYTNKNPTDPRLTLQNTSNIESDKDLIKLRLKYDLKNMSSSSVSNSLPNFSSGIGSGSGNTERLDNMLLEMCKHLGVIQNQNHEFRIFILGRKFALFSTNRYGDRMIATFTVSSYLFVSIAHWLLNSNSNTSPLHHTHIHALTPFFIH